MNRHYYFSKYLSKQGYDVKILTSSAIHNTNINMIDQSDGTAIKTKMFGEVEYTFIKTSGYQGNGLSRMINFLQFPYRLLRVYRKLEKPDLIYTSSPTPFAALAGTILAKRLHVPLVLEIRDLWPETLIVYGGYSRKNPIIKIMYFMEKWMYKGADRIVFTFPGGIDYIREKKWDRAIDVSKIHNVNNGVDLKDFAKDSSIPVDDDDLNDPSTFKIVYTGSIRKAYQIGNILDAAKLIGAQQDNIRFLIWGDGNEKGALVQRCVDENIQNVSFKGRVERQKIAAILARADVNILHLNPLGEAGLGRFGYSHNKLFDYLASGKPIVSNFTAAYDLIVSNHCGIVADGTSPEALADAILRIYRMPSAA